jgi:hypothetical protein
MGFSTALRLLGSAKYPSLVSFCSGFLLSYSGFLDAARNLIPEI